MQYNLEHSMTLPPEQLGKKADQEIMQNTQVGVSLVPLTLAYPVGQSQLLLEIPGDDLHAPLNGKLSWLYRVWRRAVDIIFGLIGTVVLLLILPILAPLIRLDSPGPVFYSQERLGLQGKRFRIYKFRSMRADAEHHGHALWADENDARITGVGRFMRASHIDELPQAYNILRGEMSLIGPRPEREEFAARLEKTIPLFRRRLSVKPGLTGWAQVKYHYARTDGDALIKLQYDLYYIKHRSYLLDIFIILLTFAEVFLHRGT